MDAQVALAIIGLGFTSGTGLVAVTVYAVNTKSIASDAQHKARNVMTAHEAFKAHAETVYARKETIAPQLAAIAQAVERIERNQEALTQRFMDGAVGG